MISILLASSSCQKDYLHEALDEADRERCQQVPGLVDRVDWRSSRFLKQQAMTALAAGARHSLSS
ncbi:MAG: hypothetical protein Q4B13_00185 [Lautropia sp.]|nr:hypothetical protein [Lautropia sp.]